MSVTLPPNEICWCFQEANFLSNFLTIGSQRSLHLGLSPMGIPKYAKGKDRTPQFRYLAASICHCSFFPIAPTLLFANFFLTQIPAQSFSGWPGYRCWLSGPSCNLSNKLHKAKGLFLWGVPKQIGPLH